MNDAFNLRKTRRTAQEGLRRGADWRDVSSLLECRGVQYSAEAAGTTGSVRCHVQRRDFVSDRRAQYTIIVCNDTDEDAHAFAFVPADGGPARTIVQTVIGPGLDFSTSVSLELLPAGTTPELRVALTSGETAFTVVVPGVQAEDLEPVRGHALLLGPVAAEGRLLPVIRGAYGPPAFTQRPPPASFSRPILHEHVRSRTSPAVLPMALFFAGLLTLVGFFVFRPQIGMFNVPTDARVGTAIPISYHATGLGTAEFTMLGPDGRTVTAGPVPLGSGGFVLDIPRTPAAIAYLVRLRVTGGLGSAVSEAYVHVATVAAAVPEMSPKRRPPPVAIDPPPQIRSLAIDRATLAAGETLNVYYDVSARGGTLAFFDPASQITYDRATLTPAGHATFVAPHVDAPRFITVVLSAQRGGLTTQSRIGFTVTPPDGTATGSDGTQAASLSAPASVRSGAPIHVLIHGGVSGLQLVLRDERGTEVLRRDVPPAAGGADFVAPPVRTAARFVIEGTYPSGAGSETMVRPITVTP